MADSAPRVAEAERIDGPEVTAKKAVALANAIKKSKHFIVFTGAGVSTSAGIPDFRGPEGAWTLRAQGRQRTAKTTSTLQAIPTRAHMALVALQNAGILKYVVSQNCDGLHRRSGILPERISEVHGNSNREYCGKCSKEYLRDFRAVATFEKSINDHRTGRKCAVPGCNGGLLDTIINFGESLPAVALESAFENAGKADLCLVLGSSLTVTPANEIPEVVGKRKGAKLVICNLQSTPLDGVGEKSLRAWEKSDELMELVMRELGVEIPGFVLERRLVVERDGEDRLRVFGVDVDGTPVSFLKSVKLKESRRAVASEPFVLKVGEVEVGSKVLMELEFMGHYNEPNLDVGWIYEEGEMVARYLLRYDPYVGVWNVTKEGT